MSISIVLNAAIAVVGPFFPPEAEKRGVDMKTIGYIFSSYPAAFVVVCLLMPTIMHYTNQRTVFVISSIIYVRFTRIGYQYNNLLYLIFIFIYIYRLYLLQDLDQLYI